MKKLFIIAMCLFSISCANARPWHGGYHRHEGYSYHHDYRPHYPRYYTPGYPYGYGYLPPVPPYPPVEPHYFSNGYWPSGNPMIFLNGRLMPDGYIHHRPYYGQ